MDKRVKAQREYMKLTGKKRFALMLMLGVEKQPCGEAYEACISYIMANND